MTAEFKRTHQTKNLGEILVDQKRGIITEDKFGEYVNKVEERVS